MQQVVVAAIVQFQRGHGLRVAAIEALGETQNRGERPHRAALRSFQIAVAVVAALRRCLAVITRDQRNRLDLVGLEAAQLAVLDQVIRMFVVTFVADVHADVVED